MSIKFEPGSSQALQDNTSSALTAGSAVLAATAYDNSSTANRYFWGDLELAVTFTSAPTAGKVIEVYLVYAPDGTNYGDTDNTTPPYNSWVGSFTVRNVTTALRLHLLGVPLRPFLLKAYVRNQTDQSMPAGWTLTIYPSREA